MSENEERILNKIAEAFAKMSSEEKQYFLGYTEAVVALRTTKEPEKNSSLSLIDL